MHPLLEVGEEAALLVAIQAEIARRVFPDTEVNFYRRRILRTLLNNGAMTFAEIGRERLISRQHARDLVQPMIKSGEVEIVVNPRHARSPLVQLTSTGKKFIENHDVSAVEFITSILEDRVDQEELQGATRVLKILRTAFTDWVMVDDK